MSDKQPPHKKVKSDEQSYEARCFDNIWDYFSKHKHDVDLATCDICSKEIGRKGGSTSGMRRHLINIHQMKPKEKTSSAGTAKVVKQQLLTDFVKTTPNIDADISEMVQTYYK